MSIATIRTVPTRWQQFGTIPAAALLAMLLAPVFTTAWSSDLAKEKRWADQVVDQLFDGEPVWLEADGVEFLGLHTAAASDPSGSVILLHGIGVHPDWPQVINPLRVGLAERGWDTLSVQMPILPNEAAQEEYRPLFPEATPRIEAGLAYLKEKSTGPVFLVGHSMGASMAAYYVGNDRGDGPAGGISGLVLIGVGIGGKGIPSKHIEWLSKIRMSVLDLFGEYDLEQVLTGRSTRADTARASGNEDFSQVESPGADHFFDGHEEPLLETVSAWLEARR